MFVIHSESKHKMGKKAKKKHTVSPFERNQEAVVVNVNKYSSLAHGNDSQEVKLIINVSMMVYHKF